MQGQSSRPPESPLAGLFISVALKEKQRTCPCHRDALHFQSLARADEAGLLVPGMGVRGCLVWALFCLGRRCKEMLAILSGAECSR